MSEETISGGDCRTILPEDARDIFKDGPTPELTARWSVEDLVEAIHPEPCRECGRAHEPDHDGIPGLTSKAREAVDKLPESPFKHKMEARLRELLQGVPVDTPEMPSGEIVASDVGKTATWLQEHNKQLCEWLDALLECCAEAYALLEETNPNDLEDCRLIAAAKEALLHGLESR